MLQVEYLESPMYYSGFNHTYSPLFRVKAPLRFILIIALLVYSDTSFDCKHYFWLAGSTATDFPLILA